MQIHLTCDCRNQFSVDDALAGREVACPRCGRRVVVPGVVAATPLGVGNAVGGATAPARGAGMTYDRGPSRPEATNLGWVVGAALLALNAVAVLGAHFSGRAGPVADERVLYAAAGACLLGALGLALRSVIAKWLLIALSAVGAATLVIVSSLVTRATWGWDMPIVTAALFVPIGWLLLLNRRGSVLKVAIGAVLILAPAVAYARQLCAVG